MSNVAFNELRRVIAEQSKGDGERRLKLHRQQAITARAIREAVARVIQRGEVVKVFSHWQLAFSDGATMQGKTELPDGELPLVIHDCDIAFFDLRGHPVYVRRNWQRAVSCTIKVKLTDRARADLKRLNRSFNRLKFFAEHPRIAKLFALWRRMSR